MGHDSIPMSIQAREVKREALECNLKFVGFIVVSCPLKADSKAVIREIQNASHRVWLLDLSTPGPSGRWADGWVGLSSSLQGWNVIAEDTYTLNGASGCGCPGFSSKDTMDFGQDPFWLGHSCCPGLRVLWDPDCAYPSRHASLDLQHRWEVEAEAGSGDMEAIPR